MLRSTWSDRLEALLWPASPGRLKAAALYPLRYLYALSRDLFSGQLTLQATGLVYVTILSIVPVIAISFSVLKTFGFHRQMEPLIFRLFAPLGEQAATVTGRIITFVDNVQGNVLASLGLATLFLTTISMAHRVEDSFNFVWRVDRPRNLARRMSDYLVVLLVGPVVMVSAMGLIAALESTVLVQQLTSLRPVAGLVSIWSAAAPYLLVCAGFTLIYWMVPNTRVRAGPAAIGGLVGGLLWTLAGVLFARFVVTAAATFTIYATFAAVILALLWLYFCWLTLLVGAQVAFYAQYPAYLRLGYRQLVVSGRQREQVALAVMWRIARDFSIGQGMPRLEVVANALGMPVVSLIPVTARLEAAGLMTRSETDQLMPARDPATIQLTEILDAVREPLEGDSTTTGRFPAPVIQMMQSVQNGIETALDGRTLASLVGDGSTGL